LNLQATGTISLLLRSHEPGGAQIPGLIPGEYSSGGDQRFGPITKQGNRFPRMLLVEAAQMAVRCDPSFRREYLQRCHTKPKGVAKVAARKLAIRRSFASRAARACPWPAKARPKL